jgi:gas vesicle protein
MASDDSGTSGVIVSFVLGALSGAALAILFAPRSGRETRELIGGKLRDTAERGRRLGEQAMEKGRAIADDASGYIDRQRDALDRRRERLAAAVEAGRQAYQEEKEKS